MAKKEQSMKKSTEKDDVLLDINFNDTSEISVPPRLIDQVIGQDDSVKIIKKAALQRRHVLLIGEPGTGKSMLGQAMAELLPKEELVDVLCLPNPKNQNIPRIATLPAGHGTRKVEMDRAMARKGGNKRFLISLVILAAIIIYALIATAPYSQTQPQTLLFAFFVGFFIFFMLNQSRSKQETLVPKLLVDNSNKDTAPFNDATGSHAGGLLGDVRHDPFQCFFKRQTLLIRSEDGLVKDIHIDEFVDSLIEKHKDKVIKNEDNAYEALFLDGSKYKLLSENKNLTTFSDLWSLNSHNYTGDIVEIETDDGEVISVTPIHKVAVQVESGEIVMKEAANIKPGDEIVSLNRTLIIDEQQIVNTFGEKDQEQYYLYQEYLDAKKNNPDWGYKRLGTNLGYKDSIFRWWYEGKHTPKTVQTINWLKERNLLPLTTSNPKITKISKVLGSLFGDARIFENLNGIFLSSSELSAVEEFQQDIEALFELEKDETSRIIEGGIEGHSWCYQNMKRAISRYFLALGAPKGRKTTQDLIIPAWIYNKKTLQEEFFASLLGSELGVPKVHITKTKLQTLDFSITAEPLYTDNRYEFISRIKEFFESKGIKCSEIKISKIKDSDKLKFRLLISTTYSNYVQFVKNIKLNYCSYKTEKLQNTLVEFRKVKHFRYNELIEKGYGAEHVMKLLRVEPKDLYTILTEEESL